MTKSCTVYTVYESIVALSRAAGNASALDGPAAGSSGGPAAAQWRLPAVFLVSDDVGALQLRDLLPRSMVLSSPLTAERPPVHVDRRSAADAAQRQHAARGVKDGVAEMVLLSACDALVHTSSGFSKAAGQWGGIPRDAIRMFDGFVTACRAGDPTQSSAKKCAGNDVAKTVPTLCAPYTFVGDYHCREPYWHSAKHPKGVPDALPGFADMQALWCNGAPASLTGAE
jgi:hypothetical protein